MPPNRTRLRGQIATPGLTPLPCGEGVEVAAQVTLLVWVVPKERRHARQRLGHHQLAHLVDHRQALLVERMHRHAEHAALHLTRHHGQVAVAAHISTRVGAAGNIAPPNLRSFDACGLVDRVELRGAPLLHLGAQG